jgi:hypothetical protein
METNTTQALSFPTPTGAYAVGTTSFTLPIQNEKNFSQKTPMIIERSLQKFGIPAKPFQERRPHLI